MEVAVLGGFGFVGSRVRERWEPSATLLAPTHAELDVLDRAALADFIARTSAPAVLNLAAWADVDGAEAQRDDRTGSVYALNAGYPAHLAELCRRHDKYLLHVSTDYVFDGTRLDRPYREDDQTGAVSWYAQTKLAGEQLVLASGARACAARIEMPFSGLDHPRKDLARTILGRLRSGQTINGVTDQRITPVFLDDATDALRQLIGAQYVGVMHVAAASWTTPLEFANSIARRLDLDPNLIQPADFESFGKLRPARRPQHSWLDVSRFGALFTHDILRPVEHELAAWVDQLLAASRRPCAPSGTKPAKETG
jgi:dTDP-4-dehydrorhamnose reductase